MSKPLTVRYAIEGTIARAAFSGLRAVFPLDAASAIGGWLGRHIGPLLPIDRQAEQRLARALPQLDAAQRRRALDGMWDNFARAITEYPRLDAFDLRSADGRIELIGAEHLDRLRDDGIGGILFSGHYGNWEIILLACEQYGLPLTFVYRQANNPMIEEMISTSRPGEQTSRQIPKGAAGARKIMKALAEREHLFMLMDQKMNDGIPVPFFGRDAMTAPALAHLALRFKCPVVPIRVERTGGARFRVRVYPPLHWTETGNKNADVQVIMRQVNTVLEDWIRERPEQWLWLHRRWPK